MKKYIVTWTLILESDSEEGALESALDAMAAGNVDAVVEELDDHLRTPWD